VWKTATQLAVQEGVVDLEVVELAALLHDIKDWKYSNSETAGVEAAEKFLKSQGFDEDKVKKVVNIIENVSFKNELSKPIGETSLSIEAAIVQDADRLDAIGAIGIARTFSYGGAKNRSMYDPRYGPRENLTKEQYMQPSLHNTSINHFHEKLFLLKNMMKTKSGKLMAEKRHAFMMAYVDQFLSEWEGNS